MGKGRHDVPISTDQMEALQSNWESLFTNNGVPIPTSGIYVKEVGFWSSQPISKAKKGKLSACIKEHVTESAETSPTLVAVAEKLVSDVYDQLNQRIESMLASQQEYTFSSLEIKEAQGATKELKVALAASILAHVSSDYIIAGHGFYVWDPVVA